MFASNAFVSPLGFGSSGSGGSSGFSGRDVVWVDLRYPAGGNGTELDPLSTANLGLARVPDGGTLVLVGGDASTEPGFTIGARSLTAFGFSGQKASGGQTPVLPTLTYAITTGTQRLAFRNISVALVHSGTAASLTECYFEFCPTVTLTAGGDAPPVYWTGDATCTFSGSGGAAVFQGGTIAGYVANSGTVVATGSRLTSDITSPTAITLVGACTFGGAISITAPSISVDLATLYNATIAGVTFSTTVHLLVPFGTPADIGTSNSTGSATTLLPSDHVHRLTFTPVQTALGAATGAVSFNSQKITNLAAPVSGGDAVNKTYADAIAVGLKVKTPAVAVATANQGTLSGTAQTIDGVALNTIGQRVLLTAQTTATQNGLWVVASGAWTRPTDFATGSGAAQSYVLVTGGTLGAGSSYFCTTATGSDVVDTNNLTWVLFSQSASVTAGAGLTKTGNTLDVVAGDATIVVHADDLVVGVLGNANFADNTIALARLVNATGQNHFMMRVSASAGAWEDGTPAQARTALGLPATGAVGGALFPCRLATTANITLSGTQTIDGVAAIAGDRVLAKNQTTGSQNGPYVVASGAWARATDADGSGELVGGMLFPISEGTANGNRVAMLTTDDPITIGSTSLTFATDRIVPASTVAPQDITNGAAVIGTSVDAARADHVHTLTFTIVAAILAAATGAISVNGQKITNGATPTVSTDYVIKSYVDGLGYLTAGAGLTLTGSTLDVVAGDATIVVNANELHVGVIQTANLAANSVTNTEIRDSTGFSVIGKTATGTGDPADIVAGSDTVLGRSGAGNLIFGQVQTGMVANDAITYAKLQNVSATSRFLGRITAAAGDAEELTGTQATTLLDTFTSSLKGLVSASGGGTSNYARADGSWAIPPGTPGGSTTQVQYNNAGVFDGASGITVVGSETAFAFGSSVSSVGFLRFPTAATYIIVAKNYDGSGDASVLYSAGNGTTFSDLYVGDSGAKGHSTLYLDAKTQLILRPGGTSVYTFSSTVGSFGSAQLSFGSTPATSGAINFTHGQTVAAHTLAGGDATLWNWGGNSTDRLDFGDTSAVAGMTWGVKTSGDYVWSVAGTPVLSLLHDPYFKLKQTAAPGSASSGYGNLYIDSTSKKFAHKDESGVVRTANGGTVWVFGAAAATTTQFLIPGHSKQNATSTTDQNGSRYIVPCPGTLSFLTGFVASASTLTVQVNNSNTSLTVGPNNSTVADNTHVVTVAQGDNVGMFITIVAGGAAALASVLFTPSV